MNHLQLHAFFVQIALMLTVAWLFGYLMKKLAQPVVLGELIGGILLGPTFLGTVYPDAYTNLFPIDNAITTSIDALLKVGMLFFMFAAGLEINLIHFRQYKFSIATTSLLAGLVPFALGFGMVLLFPELWGQNNRPLLLALFIGTALSISALPVIARILIDLNLIGTRTGMTIMASAMINDLIGWSLFAVILGNLGQDHPAGNMLSTLAMIIAFAVFILGIGRWLVQPFLRRIHFFKDWPGGLLIFVSMLVMLAAAAAEKIGIHSIFGAFMVGIAMGQNQSQGQFSEQEKHIYSIIQLFALNFFAPLYFVSVGLKVNFSSQFDGILVLVVVLIACLGKILGASLGARLGGMRWREAVSVGVGLNARGAIEIILASVALEHQLIDQRIFVALVVMALATSIISGSLLKCLVK